MGMGMFYKKFNLTKEKLVATVFEDDAESRALWQECTDIKSDQIVSCDAKDNFWEMGATGLVDHVQKFMCI